VNLVFGGGVCVRLIRSINLRKFSARAEHLFLLLFVVDGNVNLHIGRSQ